MHRLLVMQNRHLNQTAAILGGGPSLVTDIEKLPPDCLLFAVNDHAFHIGIEPDFMVFMDDPSIKPELMRLVCEFKGTRVSDLLQYTDIDMRGVVRPDARSGIFAAWLALYFSCAPIILCGMDLYTTGKIYCHNKDEFMGHKTIFDEPLEKLIHDWEVLKKYRGHENIRAMSGPLQNVFGVYQ